MSIKYKALLIPLLTHLSLAASRHAAVLGAGGPAGDGICMLFVVPPQDRWLLQ